MRKQDFIDVMEHRTPSFVPLWELHFHLWQKLSGGRFISGAPFMALSEAEKARAIAMDAETIVQWGERLGFSAVSIPDDPWDCIYTLPEEWRIRLVREIKKLKPDFCLLGSCGGVIFMPSSTDDYEDFCCRLFEEPEEIDADCKRMYESFLVRSERLAEAGLEGIYIAADIADTRSQFLNNAQLERWYYPYLKKNVEHLKKMGLYAILHTDGNVMALLDGFLACGIDALQAIDPVAHMELGAVKRVFANQAAVCGNLDCGLMLTGTPEAIYGETRRLLLDNKAGGGLVFGNSNAVVMETPVENYLALVEAWKAYGGYEGLD